MSLFGFTDGGCNPNPGPGRFAYIITDLKYNVINQFKSKINLKTTNNIMELSAIIKLLEDHGPELNTIYSDSNYCVKGITDWSKKWKLKGYLIKKGVFRPNKQLWEKVSILRDTYSHVKYIHVPAHTGKQDILSVLNHSVDKLCEI